MRIGRFAGRTFVVALAALAAFAAEAALLVRVRDGVSFDILRDGRPVAVGVRPLFQTEMPAGVRTSSSVAADGAKVWNVWSDADDGRFRFEVVERPDGAVELSMVGSGDARAKNRKRGIGFTLPADVFRGRKWDAYLGDANDVRKGAGTFGAGCAPFATRYLSAAGLVFDFNPLGPTELAGVRGFNGILAAWNVATDASGAVQVSGMSDFDATYGGFGAQKLVLREGAFADYSRDHALEFFAYEQPLFPSRLVKFGAPRAGKGYREGDVDFQAARGWGWTDGVKRTVRVGHASGAYYSHVSGHGAATYRFAGLPNGFYVATVQIGNWTGTDNRFDVSVAGEVLAKGVSIAPRKARTLSRVVHVADGTCDFALDGDWIVSAFALQPRTLDAEDFTVRRGFWYVDGYEPSIAYRSAYYRRPVAFATADETIDMPVPGEETSAPWRTPPRPVELPDVQSAAFDWTYRMKMWRILSNSATLCELADDGFREKLFAENARERRFNTVMVNGMLSRHTFPQERIDLGKKLIGKFIETAHRNGMKYLDHIDVTLLWSKETGFRTMAERLPETMRDVSNNLPAGFQFCLNNPEMRRRIYAYVREQAKAGADGFQLDELVFYGHGCACRHCRERFARETGWQLPLDETDPRLGDVTSALARRWNEWKDVTSVNWFVELRRQLKDIRPDLFLSTYSTLKNFTLNVTKASKHYDYTRDGDPAERGRVMNMFGNEVMTENTLEGVRPVITLMRLKNVLATAFGTPIWDWFHDHNRTCSFFSWGLANLCGQIPFLTPDLTDVATVPDPEAWAAASRPLDTKGAQAVAEVAVLFSVPSRNFNPRPGYAETLLGLGQELEAMHVPYEFLWNGSLDAAHLAKYKVVFLGDAQCLSDAHVALLKDFEAKGGRVYGRPGCGAYDEVGQPRANPPAFAEMPDAKPFFMDELITWQSLVSTFDPDRKAQAAFRARLAELVKGATWWKVTGLTDRVFASVWREKAGATVVQFLNGTGATLKPGETMTFDAPANPFPALDEDVRFEIPAAAGTTAVAYSPDYGPEGRPLAVTPAGEGRVSVLLPKDLLHRYALVRLEARRTHVFVRTQLKYGLERTDFLHNWYERPLYQDSSYGAAEKLGGYLNVESWKKQVEIGKLMKLDGFAFFPDTKGRSSAIAAAQRPDARITLLGEMSNGSVAGNGRAFTDRALAMPHAFRIGGRPVVTHYPEWPCEKLDVFTPMDRRCAYLPYTRLFPRDGSDPRKNMRATLRKVDGFMFHMNELCVARRFDAGRYAEAKAIIRDVYAEPEFKDKLLGVVFSQAHENDYRWTYILDSTGMKQCRDKWEAILELRPDVVVCSEWDEEDENTHFRPTVSNGHVTQRLFRHYIDRLHGRTPEVFPGDNTAVPNLVLAYRKSLQAGEVLEAEVLYIPDGTAKSESLDVVLRWKTPDGRVVKTFPSAKLSTSTCSETWFNVKVSELVRDQVLRPELVVRENGRITAYSDGFWPVELAANRCWDYKWIREALREKPKGVSAELDVSECDPDGLVHVRGRVSGSRRFRSVEILEGADTVWMAGSDAPRADEFCVRTTFQRPGCGTDYSEYVTFPLSAVPTGEVHVVRAPHFDVRVPLKDLISRDGVGFVGKNGTFLYVARFLGTKRQPPPYLKNAAAFDFAMRPKDPRGVLRVQAVDEDFRIWRGPVHAFCRPTGEEVTFHVAEKSGLTRTAVTLDRARVVRCEYDLAAAEGPLVWPKDGNRLLPFVFGGSVLPVTGIGLADGGGQMSPVRGIWPKGSTVPDVAPVLRDGALCFDGDDFAGLGLQVVPQFAGYEIALEIRPETVDGRMALMGSGNVGLEIFLDKGVPTASLVRSNVTWAKVRGPKVRAGEWQTLRFVVDQENAWFEVDGRKGKCVPYTDWQYNPCATAVGRLGTSGLHDFSKMPPYRGDLRSLAVVPR